MLCCGYTVTDFPISIRITSLALWQSNDCPSASKATLMNMDKYFMWIDYERLRNHNKAKHNKTVCIFLGIYCYQWIRSDNLLTFTILSKKASTRRYAFINFSFERYSQFQVTHIFTLRLNKVPVQVQLSGQQSKCSSSHQTERYCLGYPFFNFLLYFQI